MSELIFLAIAALAGAFKVIAILIGIVWAFRSLLSAHSIPLAYRHTHAELPFRPQFKR
ncbi:MAG: hypothetical protein WBO73_04015 [Gammaproteobacteria bacterium]|jgi:hypothetical protein